MSDLTFLRNKYRWMDLQYLFICFVLSPWYFHHTPPISNASSRRISSFCRVHVSLLYNAKLQTNAFIIQFFRWRNVWRVKMNSTWTVHNNNQYIKSKHLGGGVFSGWYFRQGGYLRGSKQATLFPKIMKKYKYTVESWILYIWRVASEAFAYLSWPPILLNTVMTI